MKHSSTKTIIDDDVSITTVDTDFEPLKDNACNEVSGELNEHVATDYDPNKIQIILSHCWIDGSLELMIKYYIYVVEFHHFELVGANNPNSIATYILISEHSSTLHIVQCYGCWVQHPNCKLSHISYYMLPW